MIRTKVLEILETAASDQWGIITTAQAHREGITRLQLGRLAEQGVIQRVRRGIYLLPSTQLNADLEIRTAWISLEPGTYIAERWDSPSPIVVSHESAALLHQIGDLIPQEHTFSVGTRKQTNQDDIHIFINRRISEAEISNLAGLPVTSVERTVADLAASKIERSYLATLATDALRKEGVRFKNLASYLNPFAAYYHANSGRDLLDEFQQEAMSIEDKADLHDRLTAIFNPHLIPEMNYSSMMSDFFKMAEKPGALHRALNHQLNIPDLPIVPAPGTEKGFPWLFNNYRTNGNNEDQGGKTT